MSTTPKEIVTALVDALKASNRYMEEYIGESHELSFQFEKNEELIRMVEPDVEDMTGPIVIEDGKLDVSTIVANELVVGEPLPSVLPDGSIVCETLFLNTPPNA